jgi:hypothetical protein
MHNRQYVALFAALTAVGSIFAFVASPAQAQDEVKYTPSATTVVLIPVVDRSGEKDKQRKDQADAAQKEMQKQFKDRGFKIADEAAVAAAIKDLKIDLNDEEDYRRENFFRIGHALHANLIVAVEVVDAVNKVVNGFFVTREGLVKTKTWLLDVDKETSILSAYSHVGKSSGSGSVFSTGGQGRQVAAAGNSVRDVLNDALKAYPVVKP